MRTIISSLLFVFVLSTGFSQSCIQKHIGKYKVDTEKTVDALVKANPEKTKEAINVTCYGAFLVAQQAAKRMLERGHGSIFFTGATASVKGFPKSSVFAMGKFGLRGLAQSLARELHPQNIHIGQINQRIYLSVCK